MIGYIIAYLAGVVTFPLIIWIICLNAETVKPTDEIYERALRQREELKG